MVRSLRLPLMLLTLFGAYLLFAGSASASELLTSAALAILATAWSMALRHVSGARFRFSRAHLRPWARAWLDVPAATWKTGLALVRALVRREPAGRADTAPFRSGASDDPVERARRATAVLAASLAPASYVVRAEPGGSTALMHGITDRPPGADREWLA